MAQELEIASKYKTSRGSEYSYKGDGSGDVDRKSWFDGLTYAHRGMNVFVNPIAAHSINKIQNRNSGFDADNRPIPLKEQRHFRVCEVKDASIFKTHDYSKGIEVVHSAKEIANPEAVYVIEMDGRGKVLGYCKASLEPIIGTHPMHITAEKAQVGHHVTEVSREKIKIKLRSLNRIDQIVSPNPERRSESEFRRSRHFKVQEGTNYYLSDSEKYGSYRRRDQDTAHFEKTAEKMVFLEPQRLRQVRDTYMHHLKDSHLSILMKDKKGDLVTVKNPSQIAETTELFLAVANNRGDILAAQPCEWNAKLNTQAIGISRYNHLVFMTGVVTQVDDETPRARQNIQEAQPDKRIRWGTPASRFNSLRDTQ